MEGPIKGADGRTVGQRIGLIREEKGFTQQSLADSLGVPRSNVRNWENDKRELKPESIVALAKTLDVSADYLLGLSEVKTREVKIKEVCEFTHLSENVVNLIRKVPSIAEAMNLLAAAYNGINILEVPLFKFSSAFNKVVQASISGLAAVQNKADDEADMRERELGTSLYRFNKACIDLPNSVILSDETLIELQDLSNELEYKRFRALLNAQGEKEVTSGEHKEN